MNIGLPWNEDFPLLGFLTNIVAAKTTLKVNVLQVFVCLSTGFSEILTLPHNP